MREPVGPHGSVSRGDLVVLPPHGLRAVYGGLLRLERDHDDLGIVAEISRPQGPCVWVIWLNKDQSSSCVPDVIYTLRLVLARPAAGRLMQSPW